MIVLKHEKKACIGYVPCHKKKHADIHGLNVRLDLSLGLFLKLSLNNELFSWNIVQPLLFDVSFIWFLVMDLFRDLQIEFPNLRITSFALLYHVITFL